MKNRLHILPLILGSILLASAAYVQAAEQKTEAQNGDEVVRGLIQKTDGDYTITFNSIADAGGKTFRLSKHSSTSDGTQTTEDSYPLGQILTAAKNKKIDSIKLHARDIIPKVLFYQTFPGTITHISFFTPHVFRRMATPTCWFFDSAIAALLLREKAPKLALATTIATLTGAALEWVMTQRAISQLQAAHTEYSQNSDNAPYEQFLQLVWNEQGVLHVPRYQEVREITKHIKCKEALNAWSPTYRIYQALASGYRWLTRR